jgi:hypothetical protein
MKVSGVGCQVKEDREQRRVARRENFDSGVVCSLGKEK